LNSAVDRAESPSAESSGASVGAGDTGSAVAALVAVLREIDPGGPSRTVVGAGHYASVLAIDDRLGIAFCADGVGTKVIVAQEMHEFETIGIDCVAMNVNDLICVGAKPVAMVDYLAVERAHPETMRLIGTGLRKGAELAEIEIPGGELAELPDLIRGHPSPHGFDLAGASFGTVPLEDIVTGKEIQPDHVLIGLPSSGIHSNGLTLARTALLDKGGFSLVEDPGGLGRPLGEELLEPTAIYVRPIKELLGSDTPVSGLAHITGDGLLNLLRLNAKVGYEIDDPLPAQPIFDLIQRAGGLSPAEMYETFNMGTGFCCLIPEREAEAALSLLQRHHPTARRIGRATGKPGVLELPAVGLVGRADGLRAV
jgi:phosphoribosylformylglycinamidine cyclo-ligase